MSENFDAYAKYYDLLYQDKSYKKEIKYISGLLSDNGIKKGYVLDLGCGTGKHAEELAKIGFSVHGVDLSPSMIQEANRKKNKFKNQLYFEVGDARNYRTDDEFDAVVSLFHVMCYQTKNESISSVFETAAKHLKPGGVFIFDYWYGPGALTDPPKVRIKRFKNKEVEILRIAEPSMRPNSNVVEVHYNIQIRQKNMNKTLELKENHKIRYLFIPEIEQLSQPFFSLKDNFTWMKNTNLDISDWNGVSVLQF